MARLGSGRRRRATSTSPRSAPARPAPPTGCRATYASGHRPAGHIRDQAVRPGRRGPRARGARLPLRGRVLRTASPTSMRIPVPPCFYSRHLRRRSRLRPACSPTWRRRCRAIRSRAATRRKPSSRWRRSPACTARVGAIPSGWTCPPIAMPKPGDDAAGQGPRRRLADGRRHHRSTSSARDISAEDQETLIAAMSLVTPWLMAEPKRYALMHGDYRLDNMLFDPDRTRITVVDWQTVGIGLPGKGSRVLHRDQPGTRRCESEIEQELVGRYHRALLGLRRHGLRRRHLLARLPARRRAGAAAQRPWVRVRRVHRTRRRDDADHVAAAAAGRSASWKRSS